MPFQSSFDAQNIPTQEALEPILREVGDRLAASFDDPIAWNAYALLYNALSDLKAELPTRAGRAAQLPE